MVIPCEPNDIVGPAGYGDARWVSNDDRLSYVIHSENDPGASAPAQRVLVENILDSHLDPRSFRLGAFGFGDYTFEVPDNRSYYSTRLGLLTITNTVPTTQTYELYVDVNAGIDAVTGKAFWILQSIDPETGASPADPLSGFLPPNASQGKGEGFFNYSVKPKRTVQTGDVAEAWASIHSTVSTLCSRQSTLTLWTLGIPLQP